MPYVNLVSREYCQGRPEDFKHFSAISKVKIKFNNRKKLTNAKTSFKYHCIGKTLAEKINQIDETKSLQDNIESLYKFFVQHKEKKSIFSRIFSKFPRV